MIKDFEATKKQLAELAEVVNKFKSESVQLKVLELLFAEGLQSGNGTATADDVVETPKKPVRKKRNGVKRATKSSKPSNGHGRSSSTGPVSVLNKLYQDGFFSKARTITDICNHADVHLARKIKQNEISGKLARMVRNRELSRKRNADNQYEYTKP